MANYYRLYGDWPSAARGPFRGMNDHGKMGVGGFAEAFAKAIKELAVERPGESPRIGEALARIRAEGVAPNAPELWIMHRQALGRALGHDLERLPDSTTNDDPIAGQVFWNVRSREVWNRLKGESGRLPGEDDFCRALGAGKRFGKRQYRCERVNQWIEDGVRAGGGPRG